MIEKDKMCPNCRSNDFIWREDLVLTDGDVYRCAYCGLDWTGRAVTIFAKEIKK